MPELPEVETIRRDLQRVLRGKRITRVRVRKAKMVRGKARAFERRLAGQSVEAVKRRGKLLIFSLGDKKQYLLMHLKMTGQLIYAGGQETVAGGHGYPGIGKLPNRYSHVIFHFTDGSALYFNDMRQFGYTAVVGEDERRKIDGGYGVEPLSRLFAPARLGEILRGRKATLKSVLLNQTRIAGLGNIYADEACFLAGLRPTRCADRLGKEEVVRLHCGIQRVLQRAIKHRGTTFNDYVDARGRRGDFARLLKVYGRSGQRCLRCKKGVIERVKAGGRSASFCPNCQV